MLLLCRPVASQPVSTGANASSAPAAVAKTGPVQADHVQVQLVAATNQWNPAEPLRLGVLFKHEPQWHTYWRNSGDSGLPTQFSWTVPKGTSIGLTEWPLPARIGIANMANYGYEGNVLLPVTVTSSGFVGDKIRFEVLVAWLVCREICIPGDALLALELPIVSGKPMTPSSFASDFAAAAQRSPAGGAIAAVLYQDTAKKRAVVVLPGATETDLEFFPYLEGWVQPAAPQKISRSPQGLLVELSLGDNPAALINGAIGVLRQGAQIREVTATVATGDLPQGTPAGEVVVTHFVGKDGKSGVSSLLGAAGSSAAGGPASVPTPTANSLSLLLALGLALLGGLLLNLMPCVLPVLSIKLLSVVQQPAQQRRDASWFALGVVGSFIALAGLLYALRSAGQAIGWGFQLQSPIFVAALAGLFTLLALNLAGVFEMGTRVAQLANVAAPASSQGNSASSAFLAGVLAVVAASPCSAPFMGSALGFALTQPLWELLLVFAALGVGMALPFFVIAYVPALQSLVPKPGRWMTAFKQALSLPMLATVAWLLWVFGLQTSMNSLLALMLCLVALTGLAWLWGRRQYQQSGGYVWLVGVAVMLASSVWLFVKATTVEDDAQVATQSSPAVAQASLKQDTSAQWQAFSPDILSSALASGKPVFIDFTAAWCVSCQVNKQSVLTTATMQKFFSERGVVLLRADWTKRDPTVTAALSQYGRQAVPVYVVYKAGQTQPVLLPELLTQAIVTSAF
jgi:thiol:disulfide interchange protein